MGEPMDVTGLSLDRELIRGYVHQVMEPGEVYPMDDLMNAITEAHEDAGGAPYPEDKSLRDICYRTFQAYSVMESRKRGQWVLLDDVPADTERAIQAIKDAEVSYGQGSEVVYGWYLPGYRKLAEKEGNATFPMKIGRTTKSAESRIWDSLGMVPEMPVVGFLMRTDKSVSWEKLLHGKLDIMGHHLPAARGREWFNTNPDELQRIVAALDPAPGDDSA